MHSAGSISGYAEHDIRMLTSYLNSGPSVAHGLQMMPLHIIQALGFIQRAALHSTLHLLPACVTFLLPQVKPLGFEHSCTR